MGMKWDYFFMFYSTIFLFLCYMDTHLTTRLVVSTYGMYQRVARAPRPSKSPLMPPTRATMS